MNTDRYKVLLTAIETGTLSTTADMLGYTPSGVSRAIASLEYELGFPLLIRSKTGVIPTEDCTKLLPSIRALLQSASNLTEISSGIRGIQSGTVTVGASANMYYRWLTKMIKEYNCIHPGINFNIIEGTSSVLAEKLEDGSIDFCIMSRREGSFQWKHLCYDELVIWVNQEHPSATSGTISVKQLAKEKFIDVYPGMDTDKNRFFKEHRITPNISYTTNDLYAYYSMVEAGLGIAVANKNYTESFSGSVVSVSLDPQHWVEIGIAFPNNEILSPSAKSFIDYAMQHTSEL